VGGGQFGIWNLNGLSLDRYGTAGRPGTTGVVGGPQPIFQTEPGWTASGDTDGVSVPLAMTYNSKLQAWVGWDVRTTLYFFFPDYARKNINIVAKNDLTGGPKGDSSTTPSFTYLPDHDMYLVNAAWGGNFYLLIPSAGAVLPQSQAVGSAVGPSKKRSGAR